MPRDFDFDFDDDIQMRPQRQAAPRQTRQPQQGGGMRDNGIPARNVTSRRKKNDTRSIIILAVEVVLFIVLLVVFFILKGKIVDGDVKGNDTATEASAEAGGESSGGVNVESPNFSLTCTKVQLANDVDGNPAALIYFTFVNKTETPLSMNEVFPPSVTQNGANCATNAVLAEQPAEIMNASTQISGGQSLECCYAISLQDFTSTLTLTIHDNYESFTDIGSTDIPLMPK